MRKTNLFIAAAAFTAVAASNLSAQSADRKGFYGDIFANYSFPTNELTDGSETIRDTQGQLGLGLGLGVGLNSQWRVGAQFDWIKTSDAFQNDIGPGADATITMYTAAIAFYPSMTSNFWIRANLGYGTDDLSGSGLSTSGSGFAYGLAVGYDWMVGKGGFAIVPYGSYMGFKTGDFGGDFSGEGVSGKFFTGQIGVQLGYKH